MNIKYSAFFVVDKDGFLDRFPAIHPNVYSHHSTIEFEPSGLPKDLRVGEKKTLPIIGRVTTDKVDVLVVENPFSKNEYPHITLSTAESVKPFSSNAEVKRVAHEGRIVPLNEVVGVVFGYHNGKIEIIKFRGGEQ